ncbi:hypothetical protein NT95_03145 [Oenococcus kitaharae]|nr:hypothetical protein NT96_09085 [Oenococcus kitaharae]OEY84120.1 hypothetical protein NT95_03145 [Oenococcus kitaharae]OEY85520.1 hypothetical protein NV75_03290 [Oenococcus kitaharae]
MAAYAILLFNKFIFVKKLEDKNRADVVINKSKNLKLFLFNIIDLLFRHRLRNQCLALFIKSLLMIKNN